MGYARAQYNLMRDERAEFEEYARYCGTRHCVGLANGTVAIELVLAVNLRRLGIVPVLRPVDLVAGGALGLAAEALHDVGINLADHGPAPPRVAVDVDHGRVLRNRHD